MGGVYQAEDSISQTLKRSFLLIELGRGRKSVWFYPSRDWALLRYPLRLGCWETPQQWREGLVSLRKSPVSRPRATHAPHPCVTTAGNSLLALPDRPDRLTPHPAPAGTCLFPSHPLHSSLNSSTWISTFIFSMNVPPAFKENSPEPAAQAGDKCCCWKWGHLCDCVWVWDDAKGQCPSKSSLIPAFLLF